MSEATKEFTIDVDEYRGSAVNNIQLIYDPENHHVWTFGNVGPGTPMPVYNGLQNAVAKLHKDYTKESLEQFIKNHEADFCELRQCYQGSTWDGRNHRGSWSDEAMEVEERIADAIRDGLETYWDAGDWFCDPLHQHDFANFSSLKEACETFVADAKTDGHHLSFNDCHETLKDRIESKITELEADDDEDSETEAEFWRRLLNGTK